MSDIEPSSLFPLIGAIQFDLLFVVNSLILVVLLFLSALISGSEVAFFSLEPKDIEELKSEKSKRNDLVLDLLSKPKELLATILITNNFVNVGIVVLSGFMTEDLFRQAFWVAHPTLAFFAQVVGITFVILLIGEVIPKVFATKNGLALARFMGYPLRVTSKVPPFSWLMYGLVYGTEIINKKAKKRELKLSTDDLEQALALTKEEDSDEEEHKILEGIVKFGNTDVKQIMCSRVDTIAIDEDSDYNEVLETILESGFSRIPVYRESFDNVIGILYVKDLLAHLSEEVSFVWQSLIRTPFFVPENKKIDDLLKDFQNRKMHMAVVVDEYGGTNGIVTLEDVLEEIVGEITDEFDDDDLVYSKINDTTYIFEGKTPLLDMYKVLNIDGREFEDVKGDSDSIAGFMIEQAGKILRKNERLHFNGLTFVVEASDKRRVKMVKVIRQPEKTQEENR
ncbi:gliding motility-associated protein GldE [Wandonia haliotis]|uniref:Gliding motility-associated protein GldE n=1 Tax=Wandonia haliotis TaxID=574963 RepID=A0ABN1MMN0_9FLAO